MRMKLGTRLACYSLASLAAVLVGFSIALYVLVSQHLHRQSHERLESALNTLMAAAEVGPDGVEWEPRERTLSFGRLIPEGGFAWRVGDERGRRIDGSAMGEIDEALAQLGTGDGPSRRAGFHLGDAGAGWCAMTLKLARPRTDAAPPLAWGRHEALVFAAATSMGGARATLRNLALTLAALSLAIWTVALFLGGRLCRVALRPVAAMAQAAHEIGGDNPTHRLPTPGSGDELDELGRSFNALLDRLAESLERQQRFAGDASHQLRTPLTAIKGHVEVALRQDRSPDEYRRVLGVVLTRSRHLCQIVDGLMFLTRADAEAMRPSMEWFVIDEWLGSYLDAWADPRQGDLIREVERAAGVRVRAHLPLLAELLGNLLDNAAKHSPPGSAIRVGLERQGEEVALSVADEGSGIDPADLPRIFDPFFRAETSRIGGLVGTGLGLSVAARIAAVLGGRLQVASEVGRGSRFTLFLPAGEATPPRITGGSDDLRSYTRP